MVQIPFCHMCGTCRCKVCNATGDEFYVTVEYKPEKKIIEIELNKIVPNPKEGESPLAFEERIEQPFDERGEFYLENYSDCIPGENGCNCN